MDQMDGLMVNSIMVYYGGSVFKIAFATDIQKGTSVEYH